MAVSFIRKASCLGILFFLCACGGGSGGGSGDGGSTNTPSASVISPSDSPASNGATANEQALINTTTSTSDSGSTSSSPLDSPCTNRPQSPCSGEPIDPSLTLNVASSEPLPKNNCKGDASAHCSGSSILQIDHGIAVTASGVQTYGVSTSDLSATADPNNPVGFKLASGGTLELRSSRSKNSMPSGATLILSNMGLSWDGKTERPPIIETFSTSQKRLELSSNGLLLIKDLPPPDDLRFYDFGQLGVAATQSHYANNIYFPRPEGVTCNEKKASACRSSESPPLSLEVGDWRTGGNKPDKLVASHYHLDGAIEVGSDVSPRNSNVLANSISIDNSSILGGLIPGAQGSRQYQQWSYGWSNLGVWSTQDKVNMQVWGGSQDFQKLISGTVAFGTVSLPERIPQSGTAIYSGNVYGWLSYDYAGSTVPFFANASVTVNFANNQVEFVMSKTRLLEKDYTDIYLDPIQATLSLDRAKLQNYVSGRLDYADMQGWAGARFFGPITTDGSGIAPAEMAGSFNMQCEQFEACPVLAGGFLLKKQ